MQYLIFYRIIETSKKVIIIILNHFFNTSIQVYANFQKYLVINQILISQDFNEYLQSKFKAKGNINKLLR